MTIKSRLRISFSLLFIVLLLLGGIAVWFIRQLSTASEDILRDNYATLQHAQSLLRVLGDDDQELDPKTVRAFEKSLKAQEENVTENSEKEATATIREEFAVLRNGKPGSAELADRKQHIRSVIYRVMDLNMQAIAHKNDSAARAAKNATLVVALLAVVCFLAAISFTFNFPGYITRNLALLREHLKTMIAGKEAQALVAEREDELGELVHLQNSLAKKMGENSSAGAEADRLDQLRLATLVDNLDDAVIGLDEHHVVVFANRPALELLGLDEKAFVHKNATEIALRHDVLRQILNAEESAELRIQTGDKETVYNRSVFPLLKKRITGAGHDPAVYRTGVPAGSLILLRNSSPSDKLDEARTHFISGVRDVFHEPVSSIKESIRAFESSGGKLTDEQRNFLENIRTDSERLEKISTDLLDMAKVETANVQMNTTATHAAEVVNYAADAIRAAAAERNIHIHVDLQPGLPAVQADQEKTAWVLVNFLSNAVRYSPDGSSIDVQVKREGREIAFSVRDYGKGIDEKYRNRIFDRYFQVPTDAAQAKSGTGLGLAIAKDFISAQNGRIWVESEPGEGSKFCFSLPAAS
ncbi:MAG: PAS domain-containing protein [Mucilaginibacter polytrichastri]|nr:PAS domain-containing protein [Mucilaginibacter polytrichastri]